MLILQEGGAYFNGETKERTRGHESKPIGKISGLKIGQRTPGKL